MKTSSIVFASALAATAAFSTGCMTERSHIVTRGSQETVSGFAQDDIDRAVQQAVSKLNSVAARYQGEKGVRMVLNVKDITNDTMSRGIYADALSEQLSQSLKEELTNGGIFVIYNEALAPSLIAQGMNVPRPDFILDGKLQQRNMRRDGGNFYQEFSLSLALTDTTNGLQYWTARIPMSKGIDRRNIMAN
ncbi:MAG: hypothetical protein IKO43_05675 [Kiritimatiellae bacterium]|nr:hypothetical protein [Kiritimatiellia bacterium]